ncbi:MAG: hypothetical protein WA705_02625 [Candidatus Ozemobacteraceae bacterium]
MKSLFVAVACVCAIMMLIPIGGSAMIATLSLDDLIINSDVIVTLTLKTSKEAPKSSEGFTKIINTLSVGEVLKGDLKPQSDIIVETISGFEDSPVFEPRARYLVFLKKTTTPNLFDVTNFVQGCWPMDPSGKLLGMGTGITRTQVEVKIIETRNKKPAPPASATVPEM